MKFRIRLLSILPITILLIMLQSAGAQQGNARPAGQSQPALTPSLSSGTPVEIRRTDKKKRPVRAQKDSPSIIVTSPAQGEFLSQGNPMEIRWEVNGDLGTDCMQISLLLRPSSGAPLELSRLISMQYRDSMQGHSTHYQRGLAWNVPSNPSMQGPSYQVRVETCDGTVAGDSGGFLFPGINPEFSVNNLRTSPGISRVSVPVVLKGDIVNMGGLNSTHNRVFTLDLLIRGPDNAPVVQETLDSVLLGAPELGFSDRYVFSHSFTPSAEGVHTASLTVQSYPGGEVMDPYQDNNTDNISFDVGPPLPDLVVCMKKRNHVKPPGSFTFPVKVKNIGHAPSGPTRLNFWVSGNGTTHYDVRGLQPQESVSPQRTLHWGSLVTGTNTFEVHIDDLEQVPELHNDNNKLRGVIVKRTYGGNSEIICSDRPEALIPELW